MNDKAVRETVVRLLGEIAPELDPAELKPGVNLRDQLDLDSMDFLNFVIAMHKEFGVEIPEADYRKLLSLDDCVAYLQAALRATAK
ncbi:MAG: acyl carrier protein [Betaproteobacteria bacterium]|nr:acyl carrier protein [Betaproteobacteria bacterium]